MKQGYGWTRAISQPCTYVLQVVPGLQNFTESHFVAYTAMMPSRVVRPSYTEPRYPRACVTYFQPHRRGAAAAVIVYDISNADSFQKAKNWVKELQRQGSPNLIMALAGNKADLAESRAVPAEEAQVGRAGVVRVSVRCWSIFNAYCALPLLPKLIEGSGTNAGVCR